MITRQHITTGIALFLLADFFIVVMNAFAKGASPFHTPIEILFYRSFVAMIFLLAFVAFTGRKNIHKTSRIKSHIWRALLGNAGVALNFKALSVLPIADVTTLLFTTPLIVIFLSRVILGECVKSWQWVVIVTGFSGVIMIAQPTAHAFLLQGLTAVLGSALCNALVIILLRDLGRTEDAFTTVFYFLAFGIFLSGIYMVFYGHIPQPQAVWFLVGTGVAGGLQLILKTQAYRLAEASLLSPFSYISLLWSALLGWMFWATIPTIWTAAGAAAIVGSNLFVVWKKKS